MNVGSFRRTRFPLYAMGLLTLLSLPVLAQQASKKAEAPPGDAAEKVKLMEQGQATLLEAAQIAEKHTKGKALEVNCRIQRGSVPRGETKQPSPGSDGQQPRLIYRVDCFGMDKTMIANVDGLEKKVIDVQDAGGPQPREAR